MLHPARLPNLTVRGKLSRCGEEARPHIRLATFPNFYISRFMESHDSIVALAALAQGTRLDAFRLLVRAEPDGLPAGELARRLAVPQNTLSAHLNVLSHARLIIGERNGRSIVYRANLERLRSLMSFLIHDCCSGRPEICGPLLADLAATESQVQPTCCP